MPVELPEFRITGSRVAGSTLVTEYGQDPTHEYGKHQIQTGAAENQRQFVVSAVFQHIERHCDILQRALRLRDQIVHFGMGGKVYNQIDVVRIIHMSNSGCKVVIGVAQIL